METICNALFQTLECNLQKSGIELDAILIVSKVNRFYFSGFRSSMGFLFITRDVSYLLVDFRYYEAATHSVWKGPIILFEKLEITLRDLCKKHGVRFIIIEETYMRVSEWKRFQDLFGQLGVHVLEGNDLDQEIYKMRRIKSKIEISKIKSSQEITDHAFTHILHYITPGMTEQEIALEIEYYMRKQGAQGVAFDFIVVAGEKTSLPHGEPGHRKIQAGDLVTMDIGAVVDGYHSDMTRTIGIGFLNEEQKSVYATVLCAQQKGIDLVRQGALCCDIDRAVRRYITDEGYEGCFGHSLGHGVGLEIHEGPKLSEISEDVLEEGMVVTVEPGIYLKERFGVRIEDMVVVEKKGCRNLTKAFKELIIL